MKIFQDLATFIDCKDKIKKLNIMSNNNLKNTLNALDVRDRIKEVENDL